jgi:hypothetical protein
MNEVNQQVLHGLVPPTVRKWMRINQERVDKLTLEVERLNGLVEQISQARTTTRVKAVKAKKAS